MNAPPSVSCPSWLSTDAQAARRRTNLGLDVNSRCVLLADRHQVLAEGVRGLLETLFQAVFIVGDETSLLKGAECLRPAVVIIDIALAEGDLSGLLAAVTRRSPVSRLLVLSIHDEPCVADMAWQVGAQAIVLKRSIATELLPAIEQILAGRRYASPALQRGRLA